MRARAHTHTHTHIKAFAHTADRMRWGTAPGAPDRSDRREWDRRERDRRERDIRERAHLHARPTVARGAELRAAVERSQWSNSSWPVEHQLQAQPQMQWGTAPRARPTVAVRGGLRIEDALTPRSPQEESIEGCGVIDP